MLVGQDLNLSDPKSTFLTATGDHPLCTPEYKFTGSRTVESKCCREGQYLSKQHGWGLKCHVICLVPINIHKTQTQRLL